MCLEFLGWIPFKELFAGALGALLGGYFTLKGARQSHQMEFARERALRLENAKRALILIKIEITAAWDVFYSEYGKEILSEPKWQPHIAVLPLSGSNFVVYESLLGELSAVDPVVAEMIVRVYSRARGLVENVRLNNSESERCLNTASEYVQGIDRDLIAMAGSAAAQEVKDEQFSLKALECAEAISMGATSQAVRDLAAEIMIALEELVPAIDGAADDLDKEISLVKAKGGIS